MGTNSGSNMHMAGLHAALWPLEIDPALEAEIERYKGRDNHVGLIYTEPKQAQMRVYDEYTPGGRILVAAALQIPPVLPGILVAPGDPLPEVFTQIFPPPEYIFINVQTGGAVVDLSAWLPTGLFVNQRVQIRKADAEPGHLVYADPYIAYTYRFADKIGEFITLLWTGSGWHII